MDGYSYLVKSLKKVFSKVVILQTCYGDRFLEKVAKETKSPFIPVKTNILFGLSILANAKVFISGRWHPSIMASLNGTPCIFLSGNSHKCLAVQHMLEYKNPHEYSCIPNQSETRELVDEFKNLLPNVESERERIFAVSEALANDSSQELASIH